jgi:hypothetical protein
MRAIARLCNGIEIHYNCIISYLPNHLIYTHKMRIGFYLLWLLAGCAIALLGCKLPGVIATHKAKKATQTTVYMSRFLDGWPMLTIRLNDTLTYPFILDTGSPVLMLGNGPVNQLGLPNNDSMRVKDYYGNLQQYAVYQLSSMLLGTLQYQQLEAIHMTNPALNDLSPGGILGLNSFSQGVLELDFTSDSLRYWASKQKATPFPNAQPVACVKNWPARSISIPLKLNGVECSLRLDTGDPDALSVTDSLTRRALLQRYPAQLVYGISGSGLVAGARLDTFALVTVDTLHLSPTFSIRNVPCKVTLTGSNTLGMGLLKHHCIRIGTGKNLLFSASPATVQAHGLPPTTEFAYSFKLRWHEGSCYIGNITVGGAADVAGIRPGDTVLAVLDVPLPAGQVAPSAVFQLAAKMRAATTEVNITVLRNGQPKEYRFRPSPPVLVTAGSWVR